MVLVCLKISPKLKLNNSIYHNVKISTPTWILIAIIHSISPVEAYLIFDNVFCSFYCWKLSRSIFAHLLFGHIFSHNFLAVGSYFDYTKLRTSSYFNIRFLLAGMEKQWLFSFRIVNEIFLGE